MDNRATLKKDFDTLELGIDATTSEINEAYRSLKNLYSSNSIAISPLVDEFTEEKSKRILCEIENAYKNLTILTIKEGEVQSAKDANEIKTEDHNRSGSVFDGSMLMHARLAKNIELKEIADRTNISKRHLINIENEKFDELPARIYLKGFILSYARYLGLDAEKISNSIIERFEIWQNSENDENQS